MGLDELVLNQEITAEEIGFLRNDIAEFVRELKRDRMDLLEILQEGRRGGIPEPTPQPAESSSNTNRAEPTGGVNSFISNLFSPRGLLAGISAASLALYAFRDDVSSTSKSFSKTFLDLFPKLLRPVDPTDPESTPGAVTETVTGNGERLLVRAARGEGAATGKKIVGAVAPSANRAASAVKDKVVERTFDKYGSAPEKAPMLQRKIMEAATSTATPKTPGIASKTISSVAKTVVAGAGKGALKTLPLIGAVAGVAFGVQRLFEGDPVGAALDISAGLAGGSGVGAPAAIAGNVYSLSRDVYNNVYGDDERKFPFEKDLIDDSEMVKERMSSIVPAVISAIKETQDDDQQKPSKSYAKERRARRNPTGPLGDGPQQVAAVSGVSSGPSPEVTSRGSGVALNAVTGVVPSTRKQVSGPLIQGTMDQVSSAGTVNVTTVNAPSTVSTQNNVATSSPSEPMSPVTFNSSTLDSYTAA